MNASKQLSPPNSSHRWTATASAAAYISQLIWDGELRRGTRIPQGEIAKNLGMSTVPVREALIRLAENGWVTLEPNRGAFVAPPTRQTLGELHDLSHLIFGYVVRRATERRTTASTEELRNVVARLADTDDPEEVWEIATDFNAQLCVIAEVSRAKQMLRSVSSLLPGSSFPIMPGAAGSVKQALPDIVEAISNGDAESAADIYLHLLKDNADSILEMLLERGVIKPEKKRPRRSAIVAQEDSGT